MLDVSDIQNQRIAVLGAGRSGISVACLLAGEGGRVLLSDAVNVTFSAEQTRTLSEYGIEVETGGHSDAIFEVDWWVISPGIPLDTPVVEKAISKSIPILGELEVASWFCKAPIIAITGSNGKSTVTAWIGKVFEEAGIPCVVAGNIGQSFASMVNQTDEKGVAVIEVSSFQLETIQSFKPTVSIMLNLTPDHIDRHGSLLNYGKAKARIFENQTASDLVIFNGKDGLVSALVSETEARLAAFGVCTDEMDCAQISDGNLVLRIGGQEMALMPVQKIGLPGEHNVSNAMATALTARHFGVDSDIIVHVLQTFKGLPHRMEMVRERYGVQWVNDSKATNVDSMRYALGSYDSPIVLIAGGRDKASDFTTLRDAIEPRVKAIILIGEAADKMEAAFQGLCPIYREPNLGQAVKQAENMVLPGQVVLLSPGCASFDMFDNFEDRGNQFKELVNGL